MNFNIKNDIIPGYENICRYCLENKVTQSEKSNSTYERKAEQLLNDTFNLQVSRFSFIEQKICKACINKLEDGMAFKQQVLRVEATLAAHHETLVCESPKHEWDSLDTCNNEDSVTKEEGNINIYDTDSKKSKTANNFKNLTELRTNTFNLVTNSNMCLFRSRKSKFLCLSCPESFFDIKDLRKHSAIHTEDFNWNPINKSLGLNCILSDISALTCKKCSKPCDDLNNLREHLQSEHSIHFTRADHILVTYKLEEGFRCLKCGANFKNFNALSIHTNSHSTKNICDVCGTAHINRTNLRHHIKTVHRQKVCVICKEVLKNTNAKARHMRMVHKKGYYKRYCLRCDDTFSYDHQLAKHMTKVHGIKPEEFKCDQCDKKFETRSGLGMHVRSIHLGERKHACSECGKRFMTVCDRRRHELTHTDSKLFTCDFCQVKLKSKDSMRRHLRTLHGKGNP